MNFLKKVLGFNNESINEISSPIIKIDKNYNHYINLKNSLGLKVTKSTASSNDKVPQLPNILIRFIFSFLKPSLNLFSFNKFKEIVEISLISKSFAIHIVPFLDFGQFEIQNEKETRFLVKIKTNGLVVVQVPLNIGNVLLKYQKDGIIQSLKELESSHQLQRTTDIENLIINCLPPKDTSLFEIRDLFKSIIKKYNVKSLSHTSLSNLIDLPQLINNTIIDSLHLNGTNIDIQKLTQLSTINQLKSLHISCSTLGELGIDRLSKGLQGLPGLTELLLPQNSLGNSIVKILNTISKYNIHLETLNFNSNSFSSVDSYQALYDCITSLKNLKSIDIGGNSLSRDFFNLFNHPLMSLTNISLNWIIIKDDDFESIGQFINSISPTIQHISLINNKTVDSIIKPISSCLSLKSLEIRFSTVSNPRIFTNLRNLKELKYLRIGQGSEYCNFEISDLVTLPSLTSLAITVCPEKNLILLDEILKLLNTKNNITDLSIEGNFIHTDGINKVLALMDKNPQLKKLNLAYTMRHRNPYQLEPEGEPILPFQCNFLEDINIFDNEFSNFDLAVILASLFYSKSLQKFSTTHESSYFNENIGTIVKDFKIHHPHIKLVINK